MTENQPGYTIHRRPYHTNGSTPEEIRRAMEQNWHAMERQAISLLILIWRQRGQDELIEQFKTLRKKYRLT